MATHITTLQQLQDMNLDLTEDYILDNDIDGSPTVGWNAGAGFIPVGTFANKFTGSFDGQNFTITGLVINRPATDYVGLFGDLSGANIQDITLANVNIIGKGCVGALTGHTRANSVISNCHSSGSVVGESLVGGLIGGTGSLGGPGDIEQISSCDSSANVTTDTVGSKTGGLIGETLYTTISNSFATGTVTCLGGWAQISTGGLIGIAQSITIQNCYATGRVIGFDYVGGLIGDYRINSTLSNCYATGEVSGDNRIGGLVGSLSRATVEDSYASGNVTAAILYAGGLVGMSSLSDIVRCCASGDVSGTLAVGGLVGWDDRANVTKCYSLGTVLGTGNNVGGLVGSHSDATATIADSFSRSPISGVDRVGGLVGVNSGIVQRCFSTGLVSASGVDPGGLVGKEWPGGATSNSFWDLQTSGQAVSDGGTGKTTAEMQTRSTFTDAGWDFATVWQMCEPPTYVESYPWLQDNDKCEAHVCSLAPSAEGLLISFSG